MAVTLIPAWPYFHATRGEAETCPACNGEYHRNLGDDVERLEPDQEPDQ